MCAIPAGGMNRMMIKRGCGRLIAFENVDFSYDGKQKILDRFSLELPENGVLCFFGPSGCGKTTLLRILAGLERPQGGCVTGPDGLRVSAVFQENRLLPWETALENVAIAGDVKPEEASRLLTKLGLGDVLDKRPAELSGGMKRRVAIARALVFPADILLLDEPFIGLEAELWTEIAREIHERYSGKPVVLVTHIAEQAAMMNARIVRLEGPPLHIQSGGSK